MFVPDLCLLSTAIGSCMLPCMLPSKDDVCRKDLIFPVFWELRLGIIPVIIFSPFDYLANAVLKNNGPIVVAHTLF